LELAPSARWSLDRVKLALGSQARWEDLFRLYDRAIEAAASELERAALLDEAAFAARDLTGDAERAIRYFVSIHALRPDDAAASAALERLYERQGTKHDLVELLAERAGRSEGAARHQFQHRIAALRLDLGQVAEASAVVEAMLEDGVPVVDVANLLERLAGHPGQGRAVERLCGHYESVGRMDDAVHLVQAALEQAESPDERARRVHDLVRLRVSAARGAPGVFARVMANFESEVSGRPALAQHVYKAVLVSAIAVLKEAPTDADFHDAADGAWRAVGALKSALLDAGDARRACRLLERAARLPFERDRRRELLEQAVQLCSGAPGDSKQAIRLYGEIFEDYDTHPFAAASLDHFAGLLEAAGEDGKLARLWERQAQHRATAGNGADPGALFLRAAAAWQRHGSGDRAVAAYERAAAFGSEASFEALARIYLGRSQWADAVRVLEWLDAHTSEPAGEGHRLRLADAYIGFGRHDRARSCLEEALRAGPTTAVAHEMRARLLEVYRCESAWGPLASLLWDEGQRSPNLEQKVAFLCEAAAVMQDKLDQPAAAADALELAVSAAPRDSRLHLVLAQLLESLGQWPRAAEVLKECVAIGGEASPKERGLLHQRLARALSRSSDLEGALAHLRVAAGLLPAHAPVLGDLGRVALDAGRLDVAANAYRTLLLVLRNPGAQGEAISRCEVILSLSRIALLKGDELHAASLLDSALDEALDGGEDPVAFERALGEMGRDDLVAQTLERRIERTPSLTDRAIALGNLVDFWIGHRGRDPELGARIRQHTETMLRELADERGASGAVWSALWSVLSRVEDLEAAVGRLQQSERLTLLLQGAIATMGPGADRARLRVLLARTVAKPGSSDEAVALLSSALEEDPSQTEASQFVEAARAVGSALELAERRDEAVRLYESILDRLEGRECRRATCTPADRRPTQVSTVRMIADRLEALGSQRLADCYELRMSLDPDAARALAPRLVELRAAQGDAEGLVRAQELGLTADPTNRILVDRLARHHEEQGDWPAVARVLSRAMDAGPDDRSLFLRVVDAHQKAGAPAEALRLLDGAIATKGSDPELRGLRAAVREAAGDDEGAVSDLLRIGTDTRSVDLVIELLARIVERSVSPAADAYAVGLVDVMTGAGRVEQARGVLDRLLGRNPQHAGALERMAALAAGQGAWDRAADAYGRLLQVMVESDPTDPSHLTEIGLAFADASERAGRAGAAREPLESILRILPESAQLAGRLEHICEITGDHERLLRSIAARAETTADRSQKAALLLRAANLLIERVGTPARALPFLERARSVCPESIEAGLAWARVQAALGRASEVVPVLREVVAQNRGKRLPGLGAVYLEIGKAHLASDDLVEAFDALKGGFAVDPRFTELALLLGLLAIDLDDDKTAERALLTVASATTRNATGSSDSTVAADRVKAIYHLAAMADARGEAAKALRWASTAVREDPTHSGARALLEKLGTRALSPSAQAR
jgi:tetratricopeptide (TPR) repeat protein